MQDFRLKTVTYGTKPAPFLTIRVLHQLAADNEMKFPAAASVLRNQCYVDDILAGGESLYTATLLRDQLIELAATAGITLGKWSANHKELLHNLFDTADADHIELTEAISTLGLL